jgi:hypothetical protein
MTDHTSEPSIPFWQVMDQAFDENLKKHYGPEHVWAQTRAAELRALINAAIPDEPKPMPRGVQPGGTNMHYRERLGRWEERQAIRQLFLAEADRADREEGV